MDLVDDEIVYKQVQFSISDFREMIHVLTVHIERLLFDELHLNELGQAST